MKFEKLNIEKWKQFENIEIDFHQQLTILTGANGAGKNYSFKHTFHLSFRLEFYSTIYTS